MTWTPGALDRHLDHEIDTAVARDCPACGQSADTYDGDCTTCRARTKDYEEAERIGDDLRALEQRARARGDKMDASLFCAAARMMEDMTT